MESANAAFQSSHAGNRASEAAVKRFLTSGCPAVLMCFLPSVWSSDRMFCHAREDIKDVLP